jgi:hypothetical protein
LKYKDGRVAEWFKATVLKTVIKESPKYKIICKNNAVNAPPAKAGGFMS